MRSLISYPNEAIKITYAVDVNNGDSMVNGEII